MAINFFNNLQVNKGYIEIDDGGLTNQRGIISYGVNGKIGQTTSWTPDIGGNPGLWVEGSNDGESGGIFMNGNTCALWSPGDQGILKIYDEDNFSQGPVYQITGTGISEGNRFASIFDTAYYLDPDGDSQLNTIDIDDYIRHRGDTNTYIGFPSNDTFIVTTASSERMRIDSAGAVSVYNDFTINNGSPEMYFQTGATHYRWMVAAQENVDAALEITPSTTTGGSTYSTPVAVFKATGNVGIGTTSPSTKLQVNGGYLRVDNSGGSDNYYLEFYEAGAQRFRIYENNNNVYFDGGPGNTHFRPRQGGGTSNFVVTGSNVGFGTSSPSRNLVVQGGGSAYLSIASGATSGSHLLMGSSFDDDEAWIQYNNNTNSMNFKVNGLFDVLVLNSDGSIQQSNSSATGQYAAAFGQNNTANSLDAFATGENTTASGRQAFAGGYNTTASGAGSFAIGGNSVASGTNSLCTGGDGTTTGSTATSIGTLNDATGDYSFAAGYNSTASGLVSFAMGSGVTASGSKSAAFGQANNIAGELNFATGLSNTSNQYTYGNLISGNSNATNGYSSVYQSSFNIAGGIQNNLGKSSYATSACIASLVVGSNNKAGYWDAGGSLLKANAAQGNIIAGDNNYVLGSNSIVVGQYNTMNQGQSQAIFGVGCVNPGGTTTGQVPNTAVPQFICGRNNSKFVNSSTGMHLFAVGNGGADSSRFTTMNVYASTTGTARVGIAKDVPAYPLDVTGTGRFTGGTTTSDERLKENIQDNTLGLSELVQLRTVTFDWKTDEDLLGRTMEDHPQNKNCKGLIAQEVEAISSDLVETDDSEYGIKSINQGAITTMLIKAIQEQQDVIESLKERIQALENN